ncbi:putative regulator of septum formation [Krasilnikovia cinnamomea]|uniref:Putative regulator of septum formation n=1 Tax=Krasilnikovia cinnamomea TaxID=349313 RepID=A0A4Q7ZJD7_9ACTN|nr:septum formation family protein [Krasilnikovia cinnamomea]RZU50614.1 putative regulator of septum formation [Krasilnikovia cinnamomea]
MRRRLRTRLGGLAAVGLAVLALGAGCGLPEGVDGNLTDDWAAIAAPTGFTPVAATCHAAAYAPVGSRSAYEQVDCAESHRSETVYVGTYPDSAAPPEAASAAAQQAYRTCDLKTAPYVGGPWRTARLWIGVTHPSAAAWTGGARWFRCELAEVSSVEDGGGAVPRVGSLKGALAQPGSPLLLTCYAVKLDAAGAIDSMPAAPCTAKHNAEFVGIWNAGTLPYPKTDAQWAKFHSGCRSVIASYAGVPNDADQQYRTGVVSLPGGADVWALGDHAVRCYAWVDGATLTSSVKGRGNAGLPILYK